MTMNWNSLLSQHRLGRDSNRPTEHDKFWTPFDADYGRAVFSAPVRRLQDKAQVFPMDPTDAVRTRLTHSMEVSSVAKGLARRVTSDEFEESNPEDIDPRSIETVVGTAALLHDLGNPPFGHAGEGAMRDWFARKLAQEPAIGITLDLHKADFLKFEGNAQSIRLVSHLQHLMRAEGLNLTCATLAALQKYVAGAHETSKSSHARKKPGFFSTERVVVNEFRKRTGTPRGARNPMALLMEAADDTCFAVVDIEDGVKKGVISWAQAKCTIRKNDLGAEVLRRVSAYFKNLGDGNLQGIHREQAHAQLFRVKFIVTAVEAAQVAFRENRTAIFQGTFQEELNKVGSCAALFKTCKEFAQENVYCHSTILGLEMKGRRVISDLLDFFWMGAEHAHHAAPGRGPRSGLAKSAYALISPNYRKVFEDSEGSSLPIEYHRFQLVADQVCGMTDSYACRLHEELRGG